MICELCLLSGFHAEQSADRSYTPDEQLVGSECYDKSPDHDNQSFDRETNLPLHGKKSNENDRRLVEKEEGIARFPAVLEPPVGEIQEAHPDVEEDHCPAPAIDSMQSPGDIKPWRAG